MIYTGRIFNLHNAIFFKFYIWNENKKEYKKDREQSFCKDYHNNYEENIIYLRKNREDLFLHHFSQGR